MRARLATVNAGAAAAAAAAALVASDPAETSASAAAERPRGPVESCRSISGFGASLRDYTRPTNLVVGPLAVLRAGAIFAPGIVRYADTFGMVGEKMFVVVKGGHRVTLELPVATRRHVGLGFVAPPSGIEWTVRNARRVVTFAACRRGEYPYRSPPTGWPVSGWVGFLLASSPRCVRFRVWVDDEPRPRRALIRFGVRDCG